MKLLTARSPSQIYAGNGRVLGEVVGERTYWTSRSPNHFFKKFNGFGISKTTIEELFERGVSWVYFDYHGVEGRVVFKVRLLDVVRLNLVWFDRSWGRVDEQLIAPLEIMQRTGV